MISPFLTAPERQGYQQVPATLSESDLRQHFHLTGRTGSSSSGSAVTATAWAAPCNWAWCA